MSTSLISLEELMFANVFVCIHVTHLSCVHDLRTDAALWYEYRFFVNQYR